MRRNVVILVFAFLLAAVVVVPAHAGGGGHGCTEGYEDGTGTTVVTKGVCFSPTVIRIQPGDTVEFRTADGIPHTVGGIAGSFGDLFTKIHDGKSLSYRFSEEGTFPYACMIHPGMGGAVVVGDGAGKAVAGSVLDVTKEQSKPVAFTREPGPTRPWLIPLGIVLGVVVLGLAAVPRRRRAGSAAL